MTDQPARSAQWKPTEFHAQGKEGLYALGELDGWWLLGLHSRSGWEELGRFSTPEAAWSAVEQREATGHAPARIPGQPA